MNVPKLRFKEFTDEWKKVELDKLYEFKNGLNGDRSLYGKGVELINVSDILNNTYITSKVINGKININENTLRKNSVEYGDILFQRSSETFLEIGTSNVYLDNKLVTFSGFVIRGKRKKDNINNPLFINYVLKSPTLRKKIIICGSGAQHYNIGQEDLKRITIFLPSIKEQKKIADMLELLDKKIELQTKKIEALKLFKKGLLNSFFQNRQPNVTIENCISYGKAGGTPSSKNKDYYDGNIPFLSISDMTSQKKYILKTEKSISQQGIKNSSAWIVPKKSIILSMYASYGLIAINKIELATSQAMFSMIVNSKNNIEYIYYYLEFLYNNNYYDRLVSIGTQANLNADKVKKIKIYLPDINSQNQISKILKLCDERIEYENKKEFELRKFKQGLLQNMFI